MEKSAFNIKVMLICFAIALLAAFAGVSAIISSEAQNSSFASTVNSSVRLSASEEDTNATEINVPGYGSIVLLKGGK